MTPTGKRANFLGRGGQSEASFWYRQSQAWSAGVEPQYAFSKASTQDERPQMLCQSPVPPKEKPAVLRLRGISSEVQVAPKQSRDLRVSSLAEATKSATSVCPSSRWKFGRPP
eukprot:2179345-Amphidinium_carterae.1